MVLLGHIVVLIIVVAFASSETEVKREEGVMVLTDGNFDAAVTENKYLLVEFYAPWCGHCKALAPEYAKAAQTLESSNSETKLAKVDAVEEVRLAEKYGVQGYPTIKFFKEGKPVEYQGGRTASEIISWLKKKTGPASTLLRTREEVDKFLDEDDVVVLGYFSDLGSTDAQTYLAVASSIDDVPFAQISDPELAAGLDIADNGIVLFKSFDEDRVVYAGNFEMFAITEFIRGNLLPLVSEFTDETAPKIFGGTITTHSLLFIKKTDVNFDKIYADFKTAAAELKGEILFVFVDAANEDNQRVIEFFGLKEQDCPDYRIIRMDQDMAKFKPETKDLSASAIIDFSRKVYRGDVKPHLNTEEIPEDWDKSQVIVLVGKNFKEVALDPNKKVFVDFYAPWCNHCKQLSFVWDRLGEKFANRDDIIIAKMDATANEVQEVDVTGFPTLKYFPDDKVDNIVDYNGARTFEALVKFIDSGGVEIEGSEDDYDDGDEDDLEEEDIDEGDEEDNYDDDDDEEPVKDEL